MFRMGYHGLVGLVLATFGTAIEAQTMPTLTGEISFLEDPLEGASAIRGELSLTAGDHVQIILNYQNEADYYLLDLMAPTACFYKVVGGIGKAIGLPGRLPIEAPDGPQMFAVFRWDTRLLFVYAGRVICRGWDDEFLGGKGGIIAQAGKVTDPFVQPLETINTRDNFMREADAEHMWTPLSGVWEVESLRDDDQADEMEADKSANAFSYQAVSTEGPAISVAEQDKWFWTNYRIEASMRSLGTGAMGLVLLAQDRSNYLAVRWASAWANGEHGDRLQLLEVVDDQPKVLAEVPGGFIPEQWYKVSAAYCDGCLTCAIDDIPILEGYSDRFGAGNPGLYAEGSDRTYFDDVTIEDYEIFRENFTDMVRWTPVEGEWSVTATGEVRCAKRGLLTSGRTAWTNYRVEAKATPNRGQIGLQVGRQPDSRSVLYRLNFSGALRSPKAQLLLVNPDGEKLIAEREVPLKIGKTLQLAASVDQGFVRAYLDGESIIEGFIPECPGGGIGLYADGEKETRFDDVVVTFTKPRPAAQVTREFTKVSEHAEMAEWASSRAPWVLPPELQPGSIWWTKGDYFGDTAVEFKLRFIGLRDGEVRVTLNGDPDRPNDGIHLILVATKGDSTLRARLLKGTTLIAQAQIVLNDSSCRVRFARQGSHAIVAIDDQPIISEQL
ncbi:MAG: hypothetical protein ACUVX8_11690 [Candidatus Zipacnadales bacterium]